MFCVWHYLVVLNKICSNNASEVKISPTLEAYSFVIFLYNKPLVWKILKDIRFISTSVIPKLRKFINQCISKPTITTPAVCALNKLFVQIYQTKTCDHMYNVPGGAPVENLVLWHCRVSCDKTWHGWSLHDTLSKLS